MPASTGMSRSWSPSRPSANAALISVPRDRAGVVVQQMQQLLPGAHACPGWSGGLVGHDERGYVPGLPPVEAGAVRRSSHEISGDSGVYPQGTMRTTYAWSVGPDDYGTETLSLATIDGSPYGRFHRWADRPVTIPRPERRESAEAQPAYIRSAIGLGCSTAGSGARSRWRDA